jgi:hypothetical protein
MFLYSQFSYVLGNFHFVVSDYFYLYVYSVQQKTVLSMYFYKFHMQARFRNMLFGPHK